MKLGEIFQQERLKLKLEPSDIAAKLNVSPKHIEIVENHDWQALDKHFYTIGLILSYAKFLKIEQKILDEKLKELPFESNVKNTKHKLVNIGEHIDLTPDNKMFFNFFGAAILLFLIFLISYNTIQDKKDTLNHHLIIEKISQ